METPETEIVPEESVGNTDTKDPLGLRAKLQESNKTESKADPLGLRAKLQSSDKQGSQPQPSHEDVYKVTGTDEVKAGQYAPQTKYKSDLEDVLLAAPTAAVEGAKSAKKAVKEFPSVLSLLGAPLPISAPQHLKFIEDVGNSIMGALQAVPVVAGITTGIKGLQKISESLPKYFKVPLPFDEGDHISPQELLHRVTAPINATIENVAPDLLKNPAIQSAANIGDMLAPIVVGGLIAKGEVGLAKDVQEGKDVSGKDANKIVQTVGDMTPKDVQDVAHQTVVDNLHPDIAPIKDREIKLKQDMNNLNQAMGQDAANMLIPEVQKAQADFTQQAQNLSAKAKLEQAKSITQTDEGKKVFDEQLKPINESIDNLNPKNDALKDAGSDLEKEKEGKLPEGYRVVKDGETLPAGDYDTHINVTTGQKITNAPKQGGQDAVQKPSTESVDVRESSEDGKGVGEGNPKGEEAPKAQEEKMIPANTPLKEGVYTDDMSDEDLKGLREEMDKNGMKNVPPIIVEENTNTILDGNKRNLVADAAGLEEKKVQYVPQGTTIEEAQKINAENEKKLTAEPEAVSKEGAKTESDGKEKSNEEGQEKNDEVKPEVPFDKAEDKPVSESTADHTKITTAEQAHTFAKSNGFKAANHLINDANAWLKDHGRESEQQKNLQDLPKDAVDAVIKDKAAEQPTTDNLKVTDEKKDILDDVTDEKTGEKKIKSFEFNGADGAKAFGSIEDGVANISGISAPKNDASITPVRGTKTFERVINKLKSEGIKTIRVKNQSADSRFVLDKLVKDGKLKNARDIIGSSGNEHPVTFDINDGKAEKLKGGIELSDKEHYESLKEIQDLGVDLNKKQQKIVDDYEKKQQEESDKKFLAENPKNVLLDKTKKFNQLGRTARKTTQGVKMLADIQRAAKLHGLDASFGSSGKIKLTETILKDVTPVNQLSKDALEANKNRQERKNAVLRADTTDPRQRALQYFISGGKINPLVIDDLYANGKKSVEGERKAKYSLINNTNGKGIDTIAHDLWQDQGEHEKYTTADYKEAIEFVLNDHNNIETMIDEMANSHGIKMDKGNESGITDAKAQLPDEAKEKYADAEFSPDEVAEVPLNGEQQNTVDEMIARHTDENGNTNFVSLQSEINDLDPEREHPETRALEKYISDEIFNTRGKKEYRQNDGGGEKNKAEELKAKVDAGAKALKDFFKNPNLPDGTQQAGFIDFDTLIDTAAKLIKKGIDLHGDISKAIDEAIEKIKGLKLWDKFSDEEKTKFESQVRERFGEGEKGEEPKTYTGIKNAQVDEERANRGFAPAMQAARKEMGASWDEAMKVLEDDPDRQNNLIEELKKKPRPLSDVENSILLHKQITLQNEYESVNEAINTARENKDYGVAEENRLRLARVSDDLQDVYNVGKAVGTENARGLNTRKMMAAEDYSLAAMETQKRAANRGERLTPQQEEEIRNLHQKIQDTQKAFDKYVKESEERISKLEAQKKVEGEVKEARKAKRTTDKQAIRTEREAIINSIKDKLKASRSTLSANPIPVDLLPDVAKLVKNYAKEGVLNLDDFVDKIHDDLKDIIGGLSKRDVRDAISGYGYEREKPTLNELTSQVNELKKQARLASRLEDLEAGRVPAKSERAKIQQSKEIEELKSKIKTKETKEKLRQRTEALQKRIAEGDFTIKKRQTVPLDNEGLLLKAKNERAKQEFKLGLEKDRLKSETRSQFLQRWFVKIERAGKLSSPITLGKLTAAALTRQVVTPLEEGVGSLWSKVFPQIAEGAPREAGLNVKAEAKALTEAWTKGLKDSYDVLKTGKSDLDVVYGKSKLPPEAIDFFGKLHGSLKTTAKRGEFARSFEKRSAYKMKQGVDMTDPLAQLETGIEAFKDAQRSIFLQDNKVANWWTDNFVGGLERSKLKGLATIANWLVPFVKIPTNIVSETTTYATGLPRGIAKATYEIMTDGIDKMTPDEKDHTLRMLKKGSIGAAALYIGYKNPQMFGGFYQKGEKRKEGEPKAMEIKVGNHNVPAWLFESPLFQVFQLGATARKLIDYYSEHPKKGDMVSAIGGTAMGLTEELPFVGQGVRMNELFGNPDERQYYLGELAKNTVDPLLLQQIAKWQDEDKKRYPKTIGEHIETGLPFLRKKVSENKKGGGSESQPLSPDEQAKEDAAEAKALHMTPERYSEYKEQRKKQEEKAEKDMERASKKPFSILNK